LPDPFCGDFVGLAPLPKDWATIAAFINSAPPRGSYRATGGRADGQNPSQQLSRQHSHQARKSGLDNLLPWEKLPVALKSSNFHQAAYCVYDPSAGPGSMSCPGPAQSARPAGRSRKGSRVWLNWSMGGTAPNASPTAGDWCEERCRTQDQSDARSVGTRDGQRPEV